MRISKLSLLRGIVAAFVCFAAQQTYGRDAGVCKTGIADIEIIGPDGNISILTEKEILALPSHTIKTHTAWANKHHEFKGVYLSDLLTKLGIDKDIVDKNGALITSSLNGYVTEIPFEDIIKYNILVSGYVDGKRMTIRDKGPWRIIYPRDDFEELVDARFDLRWTWQLKKIQIVYP